MMRRNSAGVSIRIYSYHQRCRESANLPVVAEECLWDDPDGASDCPTGILPVSCTRNQDRKQVRKDTERRRDCDGED